MVGLKSLALEKTMIKSSADVYPCVEALHILTVNRLDAGNMAWFFVIFYANFFSGLNTCI
jgi:hypothetical protein